MNEEVVIHAKQFIISAGTQETTRILLRNKNIFAMYQVHLVGTTKGIYRVKLHQ